MIQTSTPIDFDQGIFIVMKEIKLTQGQVALVDDEDFERLNRFKWCALKKNKDIFYAVTNIGGRINHKSITMHQFITGRNGTDHIDHNGCNNQKHNLRKCNQSENNMNSRKRQK